LKKIPQYPVILDIAELAKAEKLPQYPAILDITENFPSNNIVNFQKYILLEMSRNLYAISVILSACLMFYLVSCDNKPEGKPVTLTDQETLNFLVTKSDLIAIADCSGGYDKPKLSFFSRLPEKVNAKILSIIKGKEDRNTIEIFCTPMHLRQNVKDSIHILRNGKHLVFLSKNGEQYSPTTSFSLLDIHNNKAYPIWRPDQYNETLPDGSKVSSGIDLKEVIDDIENEIKKVNQPAQRTGRSSAALRARLWASR